jgi:aminoglycoside phosphotransferase (APT) family kinase protein
LTATRLHDDEIPIDVDLVRKLVDRQFPRYAARPLTRLDASGSTNVLFRLGDDLLVRLPRQPGGSASIDKEQRWLPTIRRRLPAAVPEVVALGEPALGFGERWSIVRWLDGELPASCLPNDPPTPDRSTLAADLADVILALRAIEVHEAATSDPTLRGYRGRALAGVDTQTRANIEKCRSIEDLDLDLDAALAVWTKALDLPGAHEAGPDRWYHGDLVAENLLLTDGHLTGVLDFGGLGVGDPTIDLHGAWEVLDPPARALFRARLDVDRAEWLRGRAWALAIALGTFTYYWETMPRRGRDRLAMARSVLADATMGDA